MTLSHHPTRLDIERMSAGLLDEGEGATVEAHLAECSKCQDYHEHLEAVRESLHDELPPALFAAQVFERERESGGAGGTWRRPRPRWIIGGAVATAAAAAIIIVVSLQGPPPERPGDGMRLMGSPSIRVFLRRGAQVSTLERDEPLRAGDALRIEVTVDRPSHVAVIAVTDDDDEPFALCPEGLSALAIGPGQVVLPGSIEVTEDPEPVRLLLVLREESFEMSALSSQIRVARREQPVVEWDGEGVDDVVWTMIVAPREP